MKYYVYILESEKTGSFYIGQTQDIESRLKYHNAGYNKSTKSKRPWKLLIALEVNSRSEAMKIESKLKRAKKRAAVIKFIEMNSL